MVAGTVVYGIYLLLVYRILSRPTGMDIQVVLLEVGSDLGKFTEGGSPT